MAGGRLAFFGGDLNTEAAEAPDTVTDPKYRRQMAKCIPDGPGYTLVSIKDSVTLAKKRYKREVANSIGMSVSKDAYIESIMGTDIEFGVIAGLSVLDYAYIAVSLDCAGACPASVTLKPNWHPVKPQTSVTLMPPYPEPDQVYETVEKHYNSVPVRSDHFHVLYEVYL